MFLCSIAGSGVSTGARVGNLGFLVRLLLLAKKTEHTFPEYVCDAESWSI